MPPRPVGDLPVRRVAPRRGLAVLALLGTALVLLAAPAWAKSYHFSRVEIAAEVRADGSLRIVEHRTFVFDGSFRFAFYKLPLRGASDIRDIRVADEGGAYRPATSEEPGTFRVTRTPGEVEIRWFYRAQDEARTFTLSYLLTDVVTVYTDTAELYWKFIGTGWEVRTDEAVVTVRLPGGVRAGEIRAWGHGPLHGMVDPPQDGLVRLAVRGLGAYTMLEGRILFPPRVLPMSGKRVSEPGLDRIAAEEAGWADRANRERAAARGFVAAWIGYPLAVLGLFLWLYLRYGREHAPSVPQEYYRDLPGTYPPAELGVLWRFRRVRPEEFVATVMDLARRGYLRITEIEAGLEDDYLIERAALEGAPREDDLHPYERRVLGMLFGRAERPVRISRSGGIADPVKGRLRQGFDTWGREVVRATAGRGWFDPASGRARKAVGAGALLLVVGSFLALFVTWGTSPRMAVLVLEGIPLGILVAALSFTIDRRSRPGADEFHLWRGFRQFLSDFSQMKDQPVPALTVWEHYLVYAIPLGVADRVLRQLRALYPQRELERSGMMRWYTPSWSDGRGGGNFADSVRSFTAAFTQTVTVAASPPSSSGGGGGGFSGGGGGGRGGGGGSGGGAG